MTRSESPAEAAGARDSRQQTEPAICPHCGSTLGPDMADAATCPNCGAHIRAGTYGQQPVTYEDKMQVCLPYELERVARAEAVDGWHLIDTTVSDAVPGMIEVHFRRPVHTAKPAVQRAEAKPEAGNQASTARALPQHKPPPTAQPSTRSGLTPAQKRKLVIGALVLIGLIWATDNYGVIGLLFGLWLLPQLLRSLTSPKRPRTKRRRSRRKPR